MIRLLSFNIHKGFAAGGKKFTLPQVRHALQSVDVDVVLLQEVQGEHRQKAADHRDWPSEGQAAHLAADLWPHHAYGANRAHAHGHHGNALLSRGPLLRWTNHDVSNHALERRGLLHGVIDVEGRELHVICCHLDLTDHGRGRQLARLATLIASDIPPDAPLVVAGDFNDWVGHAGEALGDLGLRDAYRTVHGRLARSFPAWLPTLPLDRIYLRGLVPRRTMVLHSPPWRGLSDHLPLWCAAEFSR